MLCAVASNTYTKNAGESDDTDGWQISSQHASYLVVDSSYTCGKQWQSSVTLARLAASTGARTTEQGHNGAGSEEQRKALAVPWLSPYIGIDYAMK